jgi:serine/threonine-protein kinase HipA
LDTASLETRLAPLYDVVSTCYYPELTRDMAMRIGGEYSSDKLSKANFEQLAEDAGLAKPLVRRRVPELAEAVLSNLDKKGIEQPVAESLARQIRERCDAIREPSDWADSPFRER